MATPKLKKNVASDELLDEVLTPEEKAPVYNSRIEVNEDGETEQFELLAGYTDDEGVLHKTFSLREMTGRDEEAISKSDVKQNPSKLVSVLLERCVMSIGTLTRKSVGTEKWKDIIKSLYVGDQDFMLIKLRELSMGGEIEVTHTCPYCKESLKTILDVSELEVEPFKGERVIQFSLPKGYRDKKGVVHKDGTLRLPTGQDREILTPIARKNVAQASTLMLTRLCKFEDGLYVTEDVMRDLTVRDREYLQKVLQENLFGINLEIDVTCTSCGEEFKGNLNATNFI